MYLSNNNGRHKGGGETVKKRRKRAVHLLIPRVGARCPIERLRLSAGPPATGNNTMWTAWISTGMCRMALVVDGERPICHSANATPTHVAILRMYNGYPWVMLPNSLIFDIFLFSDFPVIVHSWNYT
jgi:hypothetical protein